MCGYRGELKEKKWGCLTKVVKYYFADFFLERKSGIICNSFFLARNPFLPKTGKILFEWKLGSHAEGRHLYKKTSQELRMLSRSLSDCKSLLLNLNLNLNRCLCLCSDCSDCSDCILLCSALLCSALLFSRTISLS